MADTTSIRIVDRERLALFQALSSGWRTKNLAERRALSVLFRDFGLEEIEAKLLIDPDAKASDYKDAELERSVSPAAALNFFRLFADADRLFPAGTTPDGKGYPAGMPTQWARALDRLFDRIAAAFPRELAAAEQAQAGRPT